MTLITDIEVHTIGGALGAEIRGLDVRTLDEQGISPPIAVNCSRSSVLSGVPSRTSASSAVMSVANANPAAPRSTTARCAASRRSSTR